MIHLHTSFRKIFASKSLLHATYKVLSVTYYILDTANYFSCAIYYTLFKS